MAAADVDEAESRPPTPEDLIELCRHLNQEEVKYIVLGGMAIIHHGFTRATADIDLLLAVSEENDRRLRKALSYLPDQAILQVEPGDIDRYTVVRVADEIVVDLMKSACGITFEEAEGRTTVADVGGVRIPFASPELLIETKKTVREKDKIDCMFLEQLVSKQSKKSDDK